VTLPRIPYPHVLALALCVGLAAAHVIRAAGPALVVAAAVVVAAVLAPVRYRLTLLACAVAVAGVSWASLRLDALDRSVLAERVGATARTVAVVTGPARRSQFSVRVPARVQRFGRLEPGEPVLLELPPGRAPPQGARLRLITTVERPRPREGRFDERAWLERKGVHVVLRGVSPWHVVGRRGGLAGAGDRLREHLLRTIAPGVEGERRAVLAGIVLGEDEGLSDELRDRFRASGLYHLLAVSGQNVAFIAGGVLLLAWLLGVPRIAAEVGVLAAVVGYVLAVGWQPSVVRAGVAGCLASLAWLAARPRDRWYFLLLGAGVLLAWNPYSLLEPGFQLSFAAVAAIFVGVPWLERRLEGYPVPRALAGVIAVSGACGVATAPILWLQFGSVPLYSVAANALAAPVVAPMLGLGLASAALEPLAPAAALAVGAANALLAAYLAACARLVGGLPFAEIRAGPILVAAVALAGAVPAARRLGGRVPRGLVAAAALVLVAAVAWKAAPSHTPPPTGLRITFLDVGQGDAVLVQVPEGALLVDQGPPEGAAAQQLRGLGVRRLSLLVLTHPQRDHVGGAADVVEELGVDRILDPGLPAPSEDRAAAVREARERSIPIEIARAGDAYRLGRLTIRVLWPDGPGPPGSDPNERAIVLLLTYGRVDALLTADAESHVTLPLRPPPVEILKVAHHGSADPLLPALLRRVQPDLAVVSVGTGNDYGHPAPSTLSALTAESGLDLLRTDEDGRVTIESDGTRLQVREDR
jgi:competence protein ComEC